MKLTISLNMMSFSGVVILITELIPIAMSKLLNKLSRINSLNFVHLINSDKKKMQEMFLLNLRRPKWNFLQPINSKLARMIMIGNRARCESLHGVIESFIEEKICSNYSTQVFHHRLHQITSLCVHYSK
jgi:hypothetical protein